MTSARTFRESAGGLLTLSVYGPVPDPYFLTFELVEVAIFVLCLRHARRAGSGAVWQLFAGIVYGILLELVTIRQAHAYYYGQFTLMVLDVPLAMGIAWGNQIYSVRLFSNATTLPEWARPVLDALLVVYLDLMVDPIATRLGMWHWRFGPQMEYFGVPYANFWGFFWVVCSFSAGLRSLAHRPGWIGQWLAPFGAVLVGLLALILANAIMVSWVPPDIRPITAVATLFAGLAMVLILRPHVLQPPDPLAGRFLLISQGYFLTVGLISGTLLQTPILLAISLLMFSISFYVCQGQRLWRPPQEA
jgi:uncharacterized membrane protein